MMLFWFKIWKPTASSMCVLQTVLWWPGQGGGGAVTVTGYKNGSHAVGELSRQHCSTHPAARTNHVEVQSKAKQRIIEIPFLVLVHLVFKLLCQRLLIKIVGLSELLFLGSSPPPNFLYPPLPTSAHTLSSPSQSSTWTTYTRDYYRCQSRGPPCSER